MGFAKLTGSDGKEWHVSPLHIAAMKSGDAPGTTMILLPNHIAVTVRGDLSDVVSIVNAAMSPD